jgi:hypothetical protein
MLCGLSAYRKVQELAADALRRAGLENRVQLETATKMLGQALVTRFLVEKRPLEIREVERALGTVGKRVKWVCSTQTHFVPCHLLYIQNPDEFRIGPVVFRTQRSFRQRILEGAKSSLAAPDERHRQWHRESLGDATRYYRSFKWVAEVTIEDCEPEVSKRHAWRTVTAAVDSIHLIFGAGYTDRLRIGGPRIKRDSRAAVTLDQAGLLHTTLAHLGLGQVNFSEGWWSDAQERSEVRLLIDVCGAAIESAANPDLQRPLARRFLDAALWFGEGAREDIPAAAVVKYVTALERMVMTEEKDEIGTLLSTRIAALCFDPSVPGDRARWIAESKELYDLRSKLVHGSMSPNAPEIYAGLGLGAKIARFALLSALQVFREAGMRAEDSSQKRLANWFGFLIERADEIEGRFASETELGHEP